MADRNPVTDLKALLQAAPLLAGETDRERLLEHMMDALIRVFGADRCSILVPAEGSFRPAKTRNIDTESVQGVVSATIVGKVLETCAPVRYLDTGSDPDLQHASSLRAAQVRSVVCFPILKDEEVAAILYLDSPVAVLSDCFQDDEVLGAFGAHALAALENLVERQRLRRHAGQFRAMADAAIRKIHDHRHIVAADPRTKAILNEVDKVARTDVTTLITGPSGTGKELIARAIHHGSNRARGPFIAVNCAALPRDLVESELFGHVKGAFSGAVGDRPGKFELADGGTLFLDEIGELPIEMQVKLLRALQERVIERVGSGRERKVDIRLLSATNADLEARVEDGSFREDLYYRIKVFNVSLPALRERPGDILPLGHHYLKELGGNFGRRLTGFTPRAEAAMRAYPWPGNIRELRNVLERAFVLEEGEEVDVGSLPFGDEAVPPPPAALPEGLPPLGEGPLAEAVAGFERVFLRAALSRHDDAIAPTARSLGISRQGLYKKLKDLGLR